MAKISADYKIMSGTAQKFKSEAGVIKFLATEMNALMLVMPISSEYYVAAKNAMRSLSKTMSEYADAYKLLGITLEQIIDAYKNGDLNAMKDIADNDNPNNLKNSNVPSAWSHIPGEHSRADDLKAVNPNYSKADKWKVNCQRCVPTYELRRRGYDVTVEPKEGSGDHLSQKPFDVWENPKVIDTKGNGKQDIVDGMEDWPDGARAQVVVYWKGGGGHTFVAEKIDGKVVFVDPQTNDSECSDYFDYVEKGSVQYARIDNLEPSAWITDCCH